MRSSSALVRIFLFALFASALITVASAQSSTPQVATPQFSVASGAYSGPQTVTVTCSTPGATIYYTINGSPPGVTSSVYSGPITISRSGTLVVEASLGNL